LSLKIAQCALQGAAAERPGIYLARCVLRMALPLAFGSPVLGQAAQNACEGFPLPPPLNQAGNPQPHSDGCSDRTPAERVVQ